MFETGTARRAGRGMAPWPLVLLAAAGLCGASPARAQPDAQARLDAFTGTGAYGALIGQALAQLPEAVFNRCPALVSNGSQVKVLRMPGFDAGGAPVNGTWEQSFPVSGCGNDTTINLYFSADAAGKITALAGAPGSTRTDPVLQQDARQYATMAVTSKTKCADLDVETTAFVSDGANPGADLKPWSEVWTLIGCGHRYDVPLTFIPDATDGTDIVSKPGDVTTH